MTYKDKASLRLAQKRWREANKERHAAQTRAAKLKQKYGITVDDYMGMLTAQGGRCKVCRRQEPGGRGSWHVDHCHESGRVRGLLCSWCNRAIGMFDDNPSTLRAAAQYLEDSRR